MPGTDGACGSVAVRLRCPDALVFLELIAQLGRPVPPGFGMGSVGRGGSVGPSKTPSRSSTFSRRTGLSELVKIRVSLVRFRPWPPLSNGGVFRSHGLHLIPGTWLTLCLGQRIGAGFDAVLILFPIPQDGHPAQSRTRGEPL